MNHSTSDFRLLTNVFWLAKFDKDQLDILDQIWISYVTRAARVKCHVIFGIPVFLQEEQNFNICPFWRWLNGKIAGFCTLPKTSYTCLVGDGCHWMFLLPDQTCENKEADKSRSFRYLRYLSTVSGKGIYHTIFWKWGQTWKSLERSPTEGIHSCHEDQCRNEVGAEVQHNLCRERLRKKRMESTGISSWVMARHWGTWKQSCCV